MMYRFCFSLLLQHRKHRYFQTSRCWILTRVMKCYITSWMQSLPCSFSFYRQPRKKSFIIKLSHSPEWVIEFRYTEYKNKGEVCSNNNNYCLQVVSNLQSYYVARQRKQTFIEQLLAAGHFNCKIKKTTGKYKPHVLYVTIIFLPQVKLSVSNTMLKFCNVHKDI